MSSPVSSRGNIGKPHEKTLEKVESAKEAILVEEDADLPAENNPGLPVVDNDRLDYCHVSVGHELKQDIVTDIGLDARILRGDARADNSDVHPLSSLNAGESKTASQIPSLTVPRSVRFRQPRVSGRWADDDSEGDCQEIAAVWENRRTLKVASDATRSEEYNNIFTANDGLYSIAIESDREESARHTSFF